MTRLYLCFVMNVLVCGLLAVDCLSLWFFVFFFSSFFFFFKQKTAYDI